MSKDEFRKFVEEKEKESTATQPFDWKKEKDTYLSFLDALYKDVKDFLKEYIANGKIIVTERQIEIDEEGTGKYTANLLEIVIGKHPVQLVPIGTQLIGCKGRVDMKGRKGVIKIVLVNSRMKSLRDHIQVTINEVGKEPAPAKSQDESTEPIQWKWRLLTAPPISKYHDFNEECFLQALMELARD